MIVIHDEEHVFLQAIEPCVQYIFEHHL